MSVLEHDSFFINGSWAGPSSAQRLQIHSPSTESLVGSVPEAARSDVDAAVSAARNASDDPSGWSHWSPEHRAACLIRLADALAERGEEIARRVTLQNGMPIALAQYVEAQTPPNVLRLAAHQATIDQTETWQPRTGMAGQTLLRRAPLGVAAAISPWNFPQSLAAFKYASALAAGCTVVLKPAQQTVLDAVLLGGACQDAGIPPGVFNIVFGGRETGSSLISHPAVDRVAFTGSTAAGRQIAETCGRLLKPVTLELGGKSAAVVLDDMTPDKLVTDPAFAQMSLFNSGQTCWATTRILVPRSQHDAYVEAIAALLQAIPVGDPFDPSTHLGPLISQAHRATVQQIVAKAVYDGAQLVTGGQPPKELDTGWYFSPTLLTGLDNQSPAAREEIFGPVLCVIPYDDEDDAVRLADDSPYGLSGTVWTTDSDRGLSVARRIRTGTFSLNGRLTDLGAPFGGEKASGLGRELGVEGLRSYQWGQTVLA